MSTNKTTGKAKQSDPRSGTPHQKTVTHSRTARQTLGDADEKAVGHGVDNHRGNHAQRQVPGPLVRRHPHQRVAALDSVHAMAAAEDLQTGCGEGGRRGGGVGLRKLQNDTCNEIIARDQRPQAWRGRTTNRFGSGTLWTAGKAKAAPAWSRPDDSDGVPAATKKEEEGAQHDWGGGNK